MTILARLSRAGVPLKPRELPRIVAQREGIVIDRGAAWVRVRVALPDGEAVYVITSVVGAGLDCVRVDALPTER